jgi:hypothetical protein
MMLPTTVLAKPTEASRPGDVFADVALGEGGMLVGQVVDTAGVPQANVQLAIAQHDQVVVQTTSDENGVFAARGLRGGMYSITTEKGTTGVRAWAPNTAPPSAQPSTLIVQGDEVVRGAGGGMLSYIPGGATGLGIGIGIAAIAIGLGFALSDDDDNNS